jgi:hypothetical protein
MFARNSAADGSGTWTITTLYVVGTVGQYLSLAVVNGTPDISYYRSTKGDLKPLRATDVSGTSLGTPRNLLPFIFITSLSLNCRPSIKNILSLFREDAFSTRPMPPPYQRMPQLTKNSQ